MQIREKFPYLCYLILTHHCIGYSVFRWNYFLLVFRWNSREFQGNSLYFIASAKSEDTIYVLIANDSGKFQG